MSDEGRRPVLPEWALLELHTMMQTEALITVKEVLVALVTAGVITEDQRLATESALIERLAGKR